jgi:tetratricopeptide (TPR) repeat protein
VDKHVPSATPSRAQARPPDTERGLKLLDRYDGADLGTLDEAEALFNKALKSDPKDALALVGLSRVEMCRGYVADGRFDDRRLTYALTLTDRALDIAPGSGPAHLQRGYLFLYLDSLGLAEAEADKAAKAGAAASRLYGEAAMRRGDADKARALWEKAITEAGDNDGEKADSYDALGEVCMAGGDYQAAAGYFRKALILRPNSSWEASNYGLALVHMGRFDEAIEALTLSLAHKDFPEARANLAVAYLRKGVSLNDRGDTAQAEACYRSAINCDPLLMLAYKDLAALYERTGKVEKAAELCRKAMERNPGDPWAAETLKGLGQGKP